MDAGTNAKNMLENKEVPLLHGYVGVKNRSAQEISAVVAALRDSSGRKMKPMKKPVLSRARSVQGRWTAALP